MIEPRIPRPVPNAAESPVVSAPFLWAFGESDVVDADCPGTYDEDMGLRTGLDSPSVPTVLLPTVMRTGTATKVHGETSDAD